MDPIAGEDVDSMGDLDGPADVDLMRRDVEELVRFDRRTAGAGERASARYLGERLGGLGAKDIANPTFRSQSSWAPAHLVHLALGAGLAALPHPVARWFGATVAGSYELEVSGRLQWARRLLPARRGVSVWARIPAAGRSRRTLVLCAHHDAAHMGAVWHPYAVAASRRLAATTGHAVPSHAIPLTALAAAAIPSRRIRIAAGAALALSATLMVQSMRSRTAPGANDNASGVAAVLELARQFVSSPLPETTVLVVFPGGEEAGNTGIKDWLHQHRRQLDPEHTLVINLDSVGSRGPVVVSAREALTNTLSADAVERAHRAAAELDLDLEQVSFPNATDAAIMTHTGLPAVSLLSVEDGWVSHLHRPSDTVDNVDWTTVSDAVRLAGQIARTWVRDAQDVVAA
jgi:hypothetical protein